MTVASSIRGVQLEWPAVNALYVKGVLFHEGSQPTQRV